ncbi:MAG: hypothetical protein E7400_07495 [Ruminococcaceae bacterium]|nr:hypothetical protein [Oscillospiraceae bacterium]
MNSGSTKKTVIHRAAVIGFVPINQCADCVVSQAVQSIVVCGIYIDFFPIIVDLFCLPETLGCFCHLFFAGNQRVVFKKGSYIKTWLINRLIHHAGAKLGEENTFRRIIQSIVYNIHFQVTLFSGGVAFTQKSGGNRTGIT